MAFTTVETIIANPARKKRNMTAKQIKFFGSKRQRAALKRKRSNGAKRRHAPRAKARKRNPARKRARVTTVRKRRTTSHRARTRRTRKKNPGEIISLVLGNPARKRKTMARTKKRRTASVRRRSAGRRVARKNPARVHHRRRRSNPGGIGMNASDMLTLGGGAVLGSTIPKVASQFILGSKNTGWFGYLSNLAGTFLLAWGAARFAKGKMGSTLTMGIVAGGIGQVISRAITDYSILGSYGAQLGFGDYMVSNWVTPQRMVDGLNSAQIEIPNGWAPTTMIAAPAGMSGMYDPLYG